MLLALDMGNTNITLGVFKHNELLFESRIATDPAKMADQYAVELLDIFRLYGIDAKGFEGAIISSWSRLSITPYKAPCERPPA